MARIIILGGGRQGGIIANDLSGDHDVAAADVAAVDLPGIRSMQRDLSRPLEPVGTLQESLRQVGTFGGLEVSLKTIRLGPLPDAIAPCPDSLF